MPGMLAVEGAKGEKSLDKCQLLGFLSSIDFMQGFLTVKMSGGGVSVGRGRGGGGTRCCLLGADSSSLS